MFGHVEILVIAGVVLVLFGAGAIPKFARSIGRAKRELEAGLAEGKSQTLPAAADQESEASESQAKH